MFMIDFLFPFGMVAGFRQTNAAGTIAIRTRARRSYGLFFGKPMCGWCNQVASRPEVLVGMHMRASEEQLRLWMLRGLGGDAAAHDELLRALMPVLRKFYRRRMTGQEDEIEDLIQETLIAVHQRRATYDPRRPFVGWLFAIARYKMIDSFRRRGRFCPMDGLEEILVAEGFEDASNARFDVDRLLEAIPSKQAAAIRATRLEGLSTAEVASRHALGESDVKVSVHRGLKALAARVKDSLK
jgi:RNA polymerase sigma-70 factor (ECF subfamily)